ncbi:ABC transporter permease [Frankia sp. CN6]|uniref:ABC transporter permease n=1 Tax=Frankia nepalensis TaxID=1836974 RepID=A0A937UPE0_9ACTN|nr:ABC transporter permease [Frankia nepalensis]
MAPDDRPNGVGQRRVGQLRVGQLRVDPVLIATAAGLALTLLIVVWPGATGVADPLAADPSRALEPPSAAHLLGTDQLGRDVLARVIHGARYSVLIALAATAVGIVAGVPLGLLAGLASSWLDEILTRFLDILSAFPGLLLAMVLIAFTGPGSGNLVLALGVSSVPRFARVVRAQTKVVRGQGWVEHGVTLGLPRRVVVARHVLPHAIAAVPVLATVGLGGATLGAAALSFIGLGLAPPSPEWGAMLSEGRNYLRVAWWISVFPGLALTSLVLAIFTLGRRAQRRLESREPL